MRVIRRSAGWRVFLGFLLAAFAWPLFGEEGQPADRELVLNSARRAYNEKDYRFAIERFREFLARFGNSPEAAQAKLGLAMGTVDLGQATEEDYQSAVTHLNEAVGVQGFTHRPIALYYLGACYRELGRIYLAKATASPEKAAEHLTTAVKHFDAAAAQFAAAAEAMKTGLPAPEEGKPLSEPWEWLSRARCDQVEALFRSGKVPEALETAERLLGDNALQRSRYRDLALYNHGFAAYRLSEGQGITEASRQDTLAKCIQSFSQMKAPAESAVPDLAAHARYLLGRAQHLSGKGELALPSYEGVIAQYQQEKQRAQETLKTPEALQGKPEEKARLEALVKSAPTYVVQAEFYRAALLFEQLAYEKALEAFSTFAASYTDSPLAPDAALRRGISLWHLKRYPECIEALGALPQKSARLADQAHLWTGKAHVAAGDPSKPEEFGKSLQSASDSFNKAIELLKPQAETDGQAKERLLDALLHLSDTQMLARKYEDAAANYQQMLSLGAAPARNAELLYRQATAIQLAGKYAESEALCAKFRESFPNGELLPEILFRSAENAFFQATALEEQLPKEAADRDEQMKKAFTEAAGKYQTVLERAPNFSDAHLARLGQGASLYRAGNHEAANGALASIPAEEMKGKLAQAALLRADCLLRLAPASVADDVALAKLKTDVNQAIDLLNLYLASNAESPQRPAVLLKIGLCHQLLAENHKGAEERQKSAQLAAQAYDALLTQFTQDALVPQALIGKAKSLIAAGEVDKGIAELHKFTAAPLNASPLAPLALLRESMALRAQGKAQEAVSLVEQVRKQSEDILLNSGGQARDWAILLHFQHGLALKDAGKLPESKALMEDFLTRYPDRPEAPEAGLRVGQAMVAEGSAALEPAQATLADPSATQEARLAAQTARQNAFRQIDSAAEYFKQVLSAKEKQPLSFAWPRIHYELAWCYRLQVKDHFETTLRRVREEAQNQRTAPKEPAKAPEEVAAQIPYHPAEAPMAENYKTIIETWPDQAIAVDAQFELAEYLFRRGQRELAIRHLTGALAKPGRDPLRPQIHFLLGSCLDDDGKAEQALVQYEEVCRNLENPLAPYAAFRAGEALLRLNAADKAAAKFQLFADQPAFQKCDGLSDRGLLRLAFAQSQSGNHAASQATCGLLVSRFPKSPFLPHARFILGQSLQAQGQLDGAVAAYTETVTSTTDEVAARAQFQIGMCRMEKNLYSLAAFDFLKVVHGYNYPEWSAAALLKAAEAAIADKKLDEAGNYLKRLVKEFPQSQHLETAKQRLSFVETGAGK